MNEKMLKVINFLKSKNFESFKTNYFIDNNHRFTYQDIVISVEVGNRKTIIILYQDCKTIDHEVIATYYIKQIEQKINNLLDGIYKYNIIEVNK